MNNLLIVGDPLFLEQSINHLISSSVNNNDKVYYIYRGNSQLAEKNFTEISNKLFNKNKKIIPIDTNPDYNREDLYLVPSNIEINAPLDEIIFSSSVRDITVVITNIDTLVISILQNSLSILQGKNIRIVASMDKSLAQFTVFENSNSLFNKVTRIFTKKEIDILKDI